MTHTNQTQTHKLALATAAHTQLRLEGTQADALAAYEMLKGKESKLRLCEIEEEIGICCEDEDVTAGSMVLIIEGLASTLVEFARDRLADAHAGLVELAIDGALDSDATAWHLPGIVEDQLSKRGSAASELSASQDAYRSVVVSLSHLPKEDVALMSEMAENGQSGMLAARSYGFFVKLLDQESDTPVTEQYAGAFSEHFYRVLSTARDAGYEMVEFDRDGTTYNGFQTFAH
ncbi:hypothetical protein ACK8QS_22245 (plasmid) [Ectopseudomonas mendocina]